MNIMVALCCPLCTQVFESNSDAYVRRMLDDIVGNDDLSRYIL
jgi:ATP-dependent protease HslVU (ClpYQ) ATPase subunit